MFPGGKGGRCHLHLSIVLKSGSLNLLEPSGPVKACNGIALPLPQFFVKLPHFMTFRLRFSGYVHTDIQTDRRVGGQYRLNRCLEGMPTHL
jgi:hypothetical protein